MPARAPAPPALPRPRLKRLPAALALALAMCGPVAAQPGAPAPAPVVLPLVVNGTAREPVTVLLEASRPWVPVAELEAAGLLPGRLPASSIRTLRGAPHARLDLAAPLLSYRLDEADLTLTIDIAPQAMAVNAVDALNRAALPQGPRLPSAYLNYSVTGGSGVSPSLFLEGVASVRGHTFSGYLTRDGDGQVYRGPVSLALNDEQRLRQLVIGDSNWTGAGLLGSVPIGGLTAQSFFSFEPGFVASPTLDLRGVAATPSTVDLFVNGSLVARRNLPAGPFELANILAQSGSNNVTAVVRDAFGRETRVSGDPYYGSPALLRPGLVTYSVSAGRLRQDRSGASPAYRDGALLAQASLGVSRQLTVGAALQATAPVKVVAAHAAATSPVGEVSAQLAHSRSGEGNGLALSLSYRLSTPNWAVAAAATHRQHAFREAGTEAFLLGDRTLRTQELSFGRNFLDVDWSLRWTALESVAGLRSRRLSLSASRRWSPLLATSVEFSRTQGSFEDTAVFLLASLTLDAERSVFLTGSGGTGGTGFTADYVKSRQDALSTGYRLSSGWTRNGGAHHSAQLMHDTRFGDYEVQLSHSGGTSQGSWRASGALVAAGGETAAAPPIRDAFALVRVPGAQGVPVRVEGRLAGETDAGGTLVVPGLSSYSGQRVSIDVEGLPPDWEVGEVEHRVSAPLRGGAVVRFDAQRYRATAGRLVDEEGKPVASATIVLPDGRRIATAVAGEFVVEGEPPLGTAQVLRPQGTQCTVVFASRAAGNDPITRIGALRCTP